MPPEKNGDYAWLLHVLKSLKSTGKAAVILPHGVLFRGNAEADIRKKIIDRELVGEEMIFLGYRGRIDNHDFLSQDEARDLFLNTMASGNIDLSAQKLLFSNAIRWINDESELRLHTDQIALERANHLVGAFAKYRSYINSTEYQVVEPVLPMDVIAAYLFVPSHTN